MSHSATLPKSEDRASANVYRCDHCGESVISRESKAASVGGVPIVRDNRFRRRPLINAATASAWHACSDRRTAKLASGIQRAIEEGRS